MFSGSRAVSAMGCFAALVIGPANAMPHAYADPYLHAQQLVETSGHRLNVYCSGHGSPTVVLGTDGDDGTSVWRLVQPLVASNTRVCSYDPPGFGFSEPVTGGLDAATAVRDLHQALYGAGVRGSVVFVGYALSGLYARLYADRYSHDVSGMVLVSPNVPNQDRQFARVVPALAPMLDVEPFVTKCLQDARAGSIRPGQAAYAQCVYSPPDPTIPKVLLDRIHQQWQGVGLWTSFASELNESDRSSSEVLREQRNYGDMPLVVLTPTKDIAVLPITAKQKRSLTQSWIAWHAQIARLSKRGADFVLPGSSQSLPIDSPRIVVSAIDEILDQVRHTP